MKPITLTVSSISKSFDYKKIFENISFELISGDSLGITGKNGSGKSTLLRIISGSLSASSGSVSFNLDGKEIKPSGYYKHSGFSSPALNLYDEFSASEILTMIGKIKYSSSQGVDEVMKKCGVYDFKDTQVKVLSSGMKQRVKLAAAILGKPHLLFLDEPSGNLDSEGILILEKICKEQLSNGILIIATNLDSEKKQCSKLLDLSSLKVN